jgi:hypothetical protein
MVPSSSRTPALLLAGCALVAISAALWSLLTPRPSLPEVSAPRVLAAAPQAQPAGEPLVAPPKDEVRATTDAQPEPEPATAPHATEPAAAAAAWLKRILPERYGNLTAEELASLADLDLSGAEITDADLAQLATLDNLRILRLRGSSITDAGLAHLSGLELSSLDLRDTDVTAFGMASLPSASLEALHLTDSKVLGTDLYRLPPMPHLQVLKLNRLEALDDAAIESLTVFPALRHVEVDGTNLSAAGLRRLLELNPGVQRVELRYTSITPEALEKIREHHPGCEFVQDDGSSMGRAFLGG